jgi:putative thioredoxin
VAASVEFRAFPFAPPTTIFPEAATRKTTDMALIGAGGRPIGTAAAKPSADGAASPYIKESGIATFAADVLEASREVPVIVDFWAPWCGPCKQLGPALEKAVNEAKGAVRLVKINIDENQEIARQLRIQSIPTVYAFKNGQPVDGFMGAIPESQIRTFVQTLAGGGHGGQDHTAEVLVAADEAFAAGDVATAAQAYAHVLQDEPGHPRAVAGLARSYLKSGDVERAKATLQLVRPDGATDEAIRAVEAELKLREQPAQAGELAEFLAKLEANANDHQARFDLAMALDAKGDREGALDALLDIVRRDRKWNEEAARKHLVTLFEAMGPLDPRTIAARRKLSSILFS